MEKDLIKSQYEEQDSQYTFPYHFLVENYKEQIIKPFKVNYWLYDYMRLLNYLKKKINEREYTNLLDFGSGEGRLIFELRKKDLNKNFYGFEISESAKYFFKAFNPKVKLVEKLEDLDNFKNFFDTITFSEVIEHIPDESIERSISTITHCLKSGGFLLVTAPHKNQVVQKKHYRHYDSNSLLKNFDQNKFELIEKKFLFKKSLTKKILSKFFFNRLFLINFNFMYKIFFHLNKSNLFGEENNCETILLILKKK